MVSHLNEAMLWTFPGWISALAYVHLFLDGTSTQLCNVCLFLRIPTWFSNTSGIFQSNFRTRWLVRVPGTLNSAQGGRQGSYRLGSTDVGAAAASCGQRCPVPGWLQLRPDVPCAGVAPAAARGCPQWGTVSKATDFVRPVAAAGEWRDINPLEMPLVILAGLFLRARVSPPLKPPHFIRYCKWLHLQF